MTSLRDVVDGARGRPTALALRAHERRYAQPGSGDAGGDARGAAHYYDLVTDFYEYGWGTSFHFAPRAAGEALAASLRRLEHLLALRLQIAPGQHVLDAGCGVGGPMRSIARLSGASITGVTVNAYQVKRANAHAAREGLLDRCRAIPADFHALPFADGSFDAAYAIEAVCHSSDRIAVFRELARVVRPGGRIAGTDWCTTPRFDPADPGHRRVAEEIARGNGVAPLVPAAACDQALLAAGLELLETADLALSAADPCPWYRPLEAGLGTMTELRRTRPGRTLTHAVVRVLQALQVAPRGTVETAALLNRAADSLVEGGRLGIFTPLYLFVARVPERR